MTDVGAAMLLRFVTAALVAVSVAGCQDTQRPAPIYYGQTPAPSYAPPPAQAYGQPAYRPAPARAPASISVAPVPPYSAAVPGQSAPAPTGAGPRQIVIKHGDTLYAIARRYQVPVRGLIDANHLEPPYKLVAGRALTLPQAAASEPPPSVATAPAPPASAAAPVAPSEPANASPERKPAQPTTAPAEPPPESAAIPASPPSEPSASTPPSHSETAALPPPPPRGGRSFLWPVHGRIIARFGVGANGSQNDGIDIAAPEGTPVLAAEAGVVAYSGNELRGYGNLVLLKHADGWMSAYGHNAKLLVKRGDRVQRGQTIAHVGATGTVSEPQLHFELRKGTHALDPLDYLAPQAATSG
jgi:murein DD-endopeptidase MepM/ murein hydrolase activator NlpD